MREKQIVKKQKKPKKVNQEVVKIVQNMTLFDDDLFSKVFDKNIPATELVLSIILNRQITVISVNGQATFKSPIVKGRSITLDILAKEENGQIFNVEVQGNVEGSHVKRARFHSSMVDARMLKKGQKFRDIKDSYVIFLYKRDKFRKGLPVYHIERCVTETGAQIHDGSHIIYVNGSYKGDDKIGKLISDFHEAEPGKMHYKELSDGTRHYKEQEKGSGIMCDAVEKYANKKAKEAATKAASKAAKVATEKDIATAGKLMSEMKMTLDQALDFLSLKGKQRAIVAAGLQKQTV